MMIIPNRNKINRSELLHTGFIAYEDVEGGFEVRVPYFLKDEFKAVFKTAKWQPWSKTWKVGPRAEKKLAVFPHLLEELEEKEQRND